MGDNLPKTLAVVSITGIGLACMRGRGGTDASGHTLSESDTGHLCQLCNETHFFTALVLKITADPKAQQEDHSFSKKRRSVQIVLRGETPRLFLDLLLQVAVEMNLRTENKQLSQQLCLTVCMISLRRCVFQVKYSNMSICGTLQEHPDIEDEIQQESAKYIMAYKILLNLPAVLLGLFCGAWSDRIGRKLPVMLPCVGTIFAVLLYMSSMISPTDMVLGLVLSGAALRGAFGKSAVVTMALHSYISDISSKDNRTERLGRLLSMNFFGYFVGSLITGVLLDSFGFDIIFCVVVFINGLCVLITVFFMQESLPTPEVTPATTPGGDDDSKLTPEESDPEPIPILADDTESLAPVCEDNKKKWKSRFRMPFHPKHVRESLEVITRNREDKKRLHLILFFVTIIIMQTCKSGEVDITLLYVERSPLSWNKSLYGYLLATDYACLGFAVFIVLPILSNYFLISDISLIAVGLFFKTVRLSVMTFSNHTWMVYLSVVIGCPSAMVISGAKSLISKTVDEREVGKAFSLLSCCETVSNLVGSVVFTTLYSLTLHVFAGLAFGVDAIVFVALLVIIIVVAHDLKLMNQYSLLGGLTKSYGTHDSKGPQPPNNNVTNLAPESAHPKDTQKPKPSEFTHNQK